MLSQGKHATMSSPRKGPSEKTLAKKLEKQRLKQGRLAWDAKKGPYSRDKDGEI